MSYGNQQGVLYVVPRTNRYYLEHNGSDKDRRETNIRIYKNSHRDFPTAWLKRRFSSYRGGGAV